MPAFTESIKVGNQAMALYVAVPSGTGPFPAIVVIQGSVSNVEIETPMALIYKALSPSLSTFETLPTPT